MDNLYKRNINPPSPLDASYTDCDIGLSGLVNVRMGVGTGGGGIA